MNPPPMTTADLVVEAVDLTTTVMMFYVAARCLDDDDGHLAPAGGPSIRVLNVNENKGKKEERERRKVLVWFYA